jgi:hypothetical protein
MREWFSKYPLNKDIRHGEFGYANIVHVKINELLRDVYTRNGIAIPLDPIKLSKNLFELRTRNLSEFNKKNHIVDWLKHEYECDDSLPENTIRVIPTLKYECSAILQLVITEVEENSIVQGDPYPHTSCAELEHINKVRNEKTNIDSGIYNKETVFRIRNSPEYFRGAVRGTIYFKRHYYQFIIDSAWGLRHKDYNVYWRHYNQNASEILEDNIDDIVISPNDRKITIQWKKIIIDEPHYLSVSYNYLDWDNFTKHHHFHWYD